MSHLKLVVSNESSNFMYVEEKIKKLQKMRYLAKTLVLPQEVKRLDRSIEALKVQLKEFNKEQQKISPNTMLDFCLSQIHEIELAYIKHEFQLAIIDSTYRKGILTILQFNSNNFLVNIHGVKQNGTELSMTVIQKGSYTAQYNVYLINEAEVLFEEGFVFDSSKMESFQKSFNSIKEDQSLFIDKVEKECDDLEETTVIDCRKLFLKKQDFNFMNRTKKTLSAPKVGFLKKFIDDLLNKKEKVQLDEPFKISHYQKKRSSNWSPNDPEAG